MKRLLCTVMILGLAAGCSSMRIATDYSEAADFSSFRTFQFKDTKQTFDGVNPLVHQRIVDAVSRELQANGFTEVETDPDLYVSYYASVNDSMVVLTSSMGYRWGPSWRWHSPSMVRTSTTAVTYERGTLVIDLWQADEKILVWRGTVQDVLSTNPERNNDRINRGIQQAFRRFPPS